MVVVWINIHVLIRKIYVSKTKGWRDAAENATWGVLSFLFGALIFCGNNLFNLNLQRFYELNSGIPLWIFLLLAFIIPVIFFVMRFGKMSELKKYRIMKRALLRMQRFGALGGWLMLLIPAALMISSVIYFIVHDIG